MFKIVIAALAFFLTFSLAHAQVLFPNRGGTGTSTIPTAGYVLVALPNGTYGPRATSTLGLGGGGSGTVTSVDMSVPTGFQITGNPITGAGTLALAYASGYFVPTTTRAQLWDTAYGWGNHGAQGYITDGNTNWDNTYGFITATSVPARDWVSPNGYLTPSTTVGVSIGASSTISALSVTNATATNATTSNFRISSFLNFGGVIGSAWSDFCTAITGGSGLCDGSDATGSGSISTSSPATIGSLLSWSGVNTVTSTPTTTLTGTAPIVFSNPIAVLGNVASAISCTLATGSVTGCLSATDWTSFNAKVSSTSIDTSAELAALVTNETGTGNLVFSAAPQFTGTLSFGSATSSGSSTIASLTVTTGTTTNATSTTLAISNSLRFGGVAGTAWSDFCTSITGSATLCDGNDATGSGALATSTPWTNGELAYVINNNTVSSVATGTLTETAAGLELSATRGLVGGSAILSLTNGFTIPTTSSTTEYGRAYASTTALNASSPLTYTGTTGNLSIQVANGSQNGYLSSTDWQTFNNKVGTSTTPSISNLAYWTGAKTLGTIATTSLTASGALSLSQPISVIGGSASALSCATASGSQAGCLATADWTSFNGKVSSSSIDTSAELDSLVTDNTGSGALVFGTSPLFGGTLSFNNATSAGSSTFANLTVTNGTTTNATSTNMRVSNSFSFGGVAGTAWTDFCTAITGSVTLCDGSDATGGAGSSISTSTNPVVGELSYWTSASTLGTVATGTLTETTTGLELSATRGLVGGSSILSLTTGYSIPLTASTTEWAKAFASTSVLTATTPLSYAPSTGTFTIQAGNGSQNGYISSTDWTSFNGRVSSSSIDTYSELDTLVGDAVLTHNGLIDTSSEIAAIVGDETGSGALVFGTSPVFGGTISWNNATSAGSSTIANLTTINSTSTNATTTNLRVSGSLFFGGVAGTAWSNFCTSITGSADLCDGNDGGGGGVEHDWLKNAAADAITPTTTVGILVNASSTIDALSTRISTSTHATSTRLYTATLGINSENFTDLTGTGLQNSAGVLTLNATGDWTGTLDSIDASSFLRSDAADTATGLLTLDGGYTASNGTTTNASSTNLYVSSRLTLGSDAITDLTGSGILNSAGVLTCATANSSTFGCLTTTDWTAFNSKVSSTSIDTLSELETLMSGINILAETEIDAGSELAALLDDETGSAGGGVPVFSISPAITGTATFVNYTATAGTTTNASSTNFFSAAGTFTNLFGTTGTFTNFNITNGTTTNATSTNLFSTNARFTNLRATASSTIGDGTATGGLTISGNSTTTGTSTASNIVVKPTSGAATASSTVYVYTTAAGLGGQIILEDTDGAGCTVVSALNAVLSAATITCPAEI